MLFSLLDGDEYLLLYEFLVLYLLCLLLYRALGVLLVYLMLGTVELEKCGVTWPPLRCVEWW